MKSHNKFWLFMIIAGVGLGSSATAYTQLVDNPETLTQNENATATQPPEEDDNEDNEGEGDDADESDDDEGMESEEVDEEGDDEGDEMMESDDGDNAESEMPDDSQSSSDENADTEQEQEQDNPEEAFEERTHSIVDEINGAKDNKDLERVAELKQQLTEVVDEHFQWLETKRQAQVDALELRLEKLKKLLKVRSNNADKIIDRRVRSLLNEPDALDWKIK